MAKAKKKATAKPKAAPKAAPKAKAITKAELVKAVADSCELSQKKAGEVIDEVFGQMRTHLCDDGDFVIPTFGRFQVKDRDARMGRNPQTGEPIEISARKVVTFKASSVLGTEVNG